MDFNPCMKHQVVRKTVREFAENEIGPHAASLDREGRFPTEIIVASSKPEALGKEEVKPGNLLLLPNG